MKDYRDLTFNLLKVIDQKRENKRTYLYCVCLRCGNKKWIRADGVTNGSVISCGCYNEDNNLIKVKDITDKKFGRLIAKYDTGKRDIHNGSAIWFCECECGGTKEVSEYILNKDDVNSCGCLAKESQFKQGKILGEMTKRVCIEGTNIRNLKSLKMLRNNTSGYKGVRWDNARSKWYVGIEFKGKRYYLGRYEKEQKKLAAEAYRVAKEQLHGNFLEWYEKEYKNK